MAHYSYLCPKLKLINKKKKKGREEKRRKREGFDSQRYYLSYRSSVSSFPVVCRKLRK